MVLEKLVVYYLISKEFTGSRIWILSIGVGKDVCFGLKIK